MCSDGECECPEGQEMCDDVCVDTQTNNDHCGECGAACTGEPECDAGTCTACDGELTACGDSCVDTNADEDHCGSCDGNCEDDETCVGGSCTPDVETEPCTPNYTVGDVDTANVPSFGTEGPYCVKVNMSCVDGWNCSNTSGRTVQVNDTATTCGVTPLPAKVNGAYYFEFSGGTFSWASMAIWKGDCDD